MKGPKTVIGQPVSERFDTGWVNPIAIARKKKCRYRKRRKIVGAVAASRCHAEGCPYIDEDGYCPKWGPWSAHLASSETVINSLWTVRGDCCFLRWWKEDGDVYRLYDEDIKFFGSDLEFSGKND